MVGVVNGSGRHSEIWFSDLESLNIRAAPPVVAARGETDLVAAVSAVGNPQLAGLWQDGGVPAG